MKNIRIYYLLLICILVLFSCEKDQEAMLTQLRVVKEQFTPSYTSIVVECQLSTSASINDVYVQYTTSQDFADYQEEEMQKKDGKYTMEFIIDLPHDFDKKKFFEEFDYDCSLRAVV